MRVLAKSFLLSCLLLCIHTHPRKAAGEEAPEPDPRTKKMREYLNDSLGEFEIRTKTTSEVAHGEVVFRWDNQIRGSTDGCTWVFKDKQKRPIAITSVFPFRESMNHEFDVLDRRAGVSGKRNGKPFWDAGKKAVVQFKPIPGAPKPSARKRMRQTQLKLLASQFSVVSNGWREGERENLRMLPTPVYRYGSDDAKSDVTEGGIFLFVQGVDPEAALLIEAHRSKDEFRWEYALVPQTSALLSAKHKKTVIWTKRPGHAVPGHVNSVAYIPKELLER